MASSAISSKDVVEMGIDQLCDILETENIDYSCLEDIEEIRDLVLQSVCCQQSSKTEETSLEQVTSEILERDAKVKKIILDIYDCVLTMFKSEAFKKVFDSESSMYTETVENHKKQLERKEYPIVVAGETGAGKSSLLNLIMGERVLSEEVLSSTSCICRIFNSEQKKAVVKDENGREIEISDVTKKTLSKYVCVDRSEKKSERYKIVDIYWPVPMLKEYAIIVDTPGVGESDEMTTKVLEYLPEALAFIYVINTANAGGVQKDRLIKILTKQLELAEKGISHQFDPECAIFVCNKWDQVPEGEEKTVWEDIARKLKACWPTRRNVDITRQMFKMCVTKDIQRKEAGLGYSDKFQSLISEIDRLISTCLERRIRKHIERLQVFLKRILMKATATLNASRNSQKEKEAIKKEIERRLEFLENETENVKIKLEKKAEDKCRQIAADLASHLRNKETKSKMFNWHEDELPDVDDFEVIQFKARRMIDDQINNQTTNWIINHHIEDTFYHFFDLFMKECKLIRSNFREIDRIIQGVKSTNDDEASQQKTETTSDYIESSPSMFSIEDKIIIVATAPLWIPLIIGATVVAIPVFVGSVIKDTIVEKRKIKQYRENKMKLMLKLAEEEISTINTNEIYNAFNTAYLQQFFSILKEVCEQIIPKQIKADKELIENIMKEKRDYETLKLEYFPIEQKCKEIVGNLLYVKIKFLSDWQPRILKSTLGPGGFGHVFYCDVDIGGNEVQCAARRLASPIQSDPYLQLSLAEKIMNFDHSNIVKCHGISIESSHNQDENMVIFMEKCECSLAEVFLCDKHPLEMCKCNSHRRQSCHSFSEKARNCQEYMDSFAHFTEMLTNILNGLLYLHKMGCTHRGLKLSNVLVKDGIAKLSDIGMSELENLSKGIVIARPMYTAPEVLDGRPYSFSADIYSLAIMAWEMWYGRRVFSESVYSDVMYDYSSIKEHVLSGTRPKLDETAGPPEDIQKIIKNCWVKKAAKRPTAEHLIRALEAAAPL